MKAFISKSKVAGKVNAPSSKSYTIRGLMCAALAKGKSEIINPLSSDDTEAATEVLTRVGIQVNPQNDDWVVTGGNFREPQADLFCRESATTLRFMTAICSLVPGRCRLTSAPSLSLRPISPLIEALQQWGVTASYQEKDAGVMVNGGKLRGGVTQLPGNISSQFISALLFIAPFATEGASIVLTTPLESQPYVLMTQECLGLFGVKVTASPDLKKFEIARQRYHPARYRVEGDWSSASYLLALGALCGAMTVDNLNPVSLQGDKIIADILRQMGASVNTGENAIEVKASKLKGIETNLSDCIDLLPTIAVLAAAAGGQSELYGIERARLKESNRVGAVREGLERMGINVVEEKNRLVITGSKPKGALIDSKGDHRIAMAFSLLGMVAGDTVIDGAECVAKTYPDFWNTLKILGGGVKIDGE